MATTGTQTTQTVSATIKAFQDKVKAQVEEAKTTLAQAEAKAKNKKAQADITAAAKLNAAKVDIDRRLQDLKATNAVHVARAKAYIATDVAHFKTAVDDLAAKVSKS
jgi:predicted  nucleic acid-binding Zn-ribbon protein